MSEETIVVVAREHLPEEARFSGVRRGANPFLDALRQHWFRAPRGCAESRSDWKQPIPYILIRRGEQIFTTVRSSDGEERRLRNKVSIGIGGHLRPGDHTTFEDLLLENAYRELNEELFLRPRPSPEDLRGRLSFLGVLNDEGNDVGRCHLGFLYLLDIAESVSVEVRERDKLTGDFRSPAAIPRDANTETWSLLALELLEEGETLVE